MVAEVFVAFFLGTAPPFQQLPQHYGMSPFSEREAGCDQKHSIVVGQKIGHVHGRVL